MVARESIARRSLSLVESCYQSRHSSRGHLQQAPICRDTMDRLGKLIERLSVRRNEEDAVDRLHYQKTAILLVCAAIAILTKEYGGNAIRCWTTAEWQSSWIEYAQDYCFVSNTYHLPGSQNLDSHVERYEKHHQILYYQWLPFALVFQALALYLPYFIWTHFNRINGLHVRAILTEAYLAERELGISSIQRERIAELLFNTFKMRLDFLNSKKHRRSSLGRLLIGLRVYTGGFRLSALYILTKALFIVVSVAQILIISAVFYDPFSATKTERFGFGTLSKMLDGRSWDESGHFPRVGMCDFRIRSVGMKSDPHTVQCVLAANNLNEKIYVGVFWWLAMLVVAGAASLVRWLLVLTSRRRQREFLRGCIFEGNSLNEAARVKDEAAERQKIQQQVEKAIRLRGECLKWAEGDEGVARHFEEILTFTMHGGEDAQDKKRVEFEAMPAFHIDAFLSFIGMDGVLLFRLMKINATDTVTSALCAHLYYTFCVKMHRDDLSPSSDSTVGSPIGSPVYPISSLKGRLSHKRPPTCILPQTH